MNFHIETPRLLLREFRLEDAEPLYKMNSNPEVLRYLGGKVYTHIDQAVYDITFVRQQYQELGVGRCAVVERCSGDMIGWSGLKHVVKPDFPNKAAYYDIGYRFQPQYWGKGYATETALASIEYGFAALGLSAICGTAEMNNLASRHVLQKIGMQQSDTVYYEGTPIAWLEITAEEWDVHKRSVQVIRFERAIATDAELLTSIALQSKKQWGYSDQQMQLWQADLQVSEEYIAANLVVKVYDASRLVGFYGVVQHGTLAEIDHLWLLPGQWRKGYGRKLFGHLIDSVRSLDCTKAILTAEPNAAAFYNAMGGIHYKTTESKIAGRMLEEFEFIV